MEKRNNLQKYLPFFLFILVFSVYFITDKAPSPESRWVVPTALNIVKNHTTNLDSYRELAQSQQFYGIYQANGHLYANYPLLPSIIAVPFVWICAESSSIFHYDFSSSIAIGGGRKCELFIAALLTALSVILIYFTAKRFLTNRFAVLVTLIFAFCTPAWSTASMGLHPQTITLLISSLIIFLLAQESIKPTTIALLGFITAAACLTRPLYILIFILISVFVLIKFRKYFLWYAAAALVIFIPLALYNIAIYDSYYDASFSLLNYSGDNVLLAIIGNLISPARGIFIYSPILLFCVAGIYFVSKSKKPIVSYDWLFIIIICSGYIFMSSQYNWWGNYSFGPAELTDLFPFLIYFLILFIRWQNDRRKSIAFTYRSIIVLSVLSLIINYRGAASVVVSQWNNTPDDVATHTERLWQWNDIAFLRFDVPGKPLATAIKKVSTDFTTDSTTFDKAKYTTTLYDAKYLLQLLPGNYYNKKSLQQSFQKRFFTHDSLFLTNAGIYIRLQPFGYDENKNFLFEFTYPSSLKYTFLGNNPKIPVVCFPHPDLTHDFAWAVVKLRNILPITKTVYVRLFYQNTSYWFPTNDSINNDTSCLDNFYGCSAVLAVTLKAGENGTFKLPYKIGFDPKNKLIGKTKWLISARPGNYEFMAIISEHADDPLMSYTLNLNKTNPFAVVKNDELHNKGKQYFYNMAYVGPHHFKFVFLNDNFDGHNDLKTTDVYIAKDHAEKKLCDTCNGNWFKNVISDNWTDSDFFKGDVSRAKKIQVAYGNRKENFYFSNGKAIIKVPGSTPQKKQKTWGEFMFEPSFKYGHITVRAKFSQIINKAGRPIGVVHNLWLYQRDYMHMPPDPKNPYHTLTNALGNQPYEIDFEIWSSRFLSQAWDNKALINYSVVDYMRNPDVDIKPGEQKKIGNYIIDRLNKHQANIPGTKFDNKFFNYYHLYEIYWTPSSVRYLVDGQEKAYFTNKEVKIPDQELYLWIGSPIYQDGTYYSQTNVPFFPNDLFSEIDWIRIE